MMQGNPFDQFDSAQDGVTFQPLPAKPPAPVDPLVQEGRQLENEIKRRKLAETPEAEKAKNDPKRRQQVQAILDTITRLENITRDGSGIGNIEGSESFRDGEDYLGLSSFFNQDANDVAGLLKQVEGDLIQQQIAKLSEMNNGKGVTGLANTDAEARRIASAIAPLSPTMSDPQFAEGLKKARQYYEALLAEQGGAALNEAGDTAQGGTGYGSANPTPPPVSAGSDQISAADGYRTETDPAFAAVADEYRKRLGSGQKASEIVPWLRSQGVAPSALIQAVKQIQYRDQNPQVPIDRYPVSSEVRVPTSTFEQVTTDIGQTAPGAYALGAGQFLSGNTLDNLTDDPERARLSLDVARAENPTATTFGEISGGVMGALTGEAGLARMGMASGLGRAVLADSTMGAATGAGAADDGNRFLGAAQGGLAAAAGSFGGGLAMRGAGAALTPSGGKLADLYAEGIRPTPGQRFADSGIAGRALNATEEAFQSIPIVGAAISGARQEARDQFQTAAFNQSLREIGLELPQGVAKGTEAHKFAQRAFSEVYDQARSGMRVVPDEQLATDLNALSPDIQTLGPQAQNKLKAIMANTVKDDLSGDTYKRTMSGLGKHIARLRKSTSGEEQQLADVLEGVRDSLDSAARRHSDPEAVKLLDAADAGYAKLVRIEEAAARRGGAAGEFNPNAFDSSVQKTSGGVRSKAYLRGDANMQEFAQAGKSLEDRMPNSATTDRALAATAVAGGAAYLEPTTLGLLGGLGALYAPGGRKLTKGVLAPSEGKRKAIASTLKKIERLTSAASAASGARATIPSR